MCDIWATQKRKGDAGEAVILELAARKNKVVDVSNNPEYWEKDIDAFINDIPVEIKTDYVISRTGNLFLEDEIEHYSAVENVYKKVKTTKGYFKATKAEFLFYFDINNSELLIYKIDELREFVKCNSTPYKSRNDFYESDYMRKISGYCLNKEAVPHMKVEVI